MSEGTRRERRFRSVLPGGADAAALAVSDVATRRAAAAVVTTLETREVVGQLARRWASVGNPQRAGHLFEVMHAGTFNRNAASAGSSARAYVEAWTAGGSPVGKVDVRLVDGATARKVQAKVIGDTVRARRAVASHDYLGMDRLVPADTVDAVDDLLDKALKRPKDGVFYADYADARARLTSVLRVGGVTSDPVTTTQVHADARDPVRWANRHVAGVAARQVATGAAAGAAAGALVGGLTATATEAARARAGETSAGAAVLTVVGACARNAVRSGGMAALTQSVQVAAKAKLLPAALGGGTVPAAVAQAVAGVADAAVAYARGSLDAGELAARSCTATAGASFAWAGALVGQTAVPLPVVGALVGGVVGQAAAVLLVQGIQIAISVARAENADPLRIEVLEAEAVTTAATAAALCELTRQAGAAHHAYLTDTLAPELRELTAALGSARPETATDILSGLTSTYNTQPVFGTVGEFDRWMADHDAALILDPNW